MANEKTASKSKAKTIESESPKNIKAPKKSSTKKKNSGLSLYSNLAYKRRVKEDARARKKAEELAKLPKNPILRFFAKLRPDRFFRAWFSKEGQIRILKFFVFMILVGVLAIGGLFLYYKKDLAEINPEKLAESVQDTVNVYLDRNGEVLWEDKGSGDYRLVVDGEDISTYMRQATVAIEDKNFYNHIGVDFTALARAAYVTVSGGAVQGGSTLTQQLIKQVYFSEEAGDRTVSGIPRKIKEMILAIEVEKMYDKEQIITLYLNESPYGGRRNGVESAAQTYFGKNAKDLNLAESALLAAIPNNPGLYNPYNTYGNEALIERQHKVLNMMEDMGYITAEQKEEALGIDILAQILPEANQYENIKAPWHVLEVKSQLEAKYGIKTMREGGFTIKTTVDMRAQRIAEQAVAEGAQYFYTNGADNITLVSVDVETSQVIAMVGSVDWNREGYGQVNAATSLIEPGSSIKPILDYAPLFEQREGLNYAPGTILKDENIDKIYCAGSYGGCSLRNATGKFFGNLTIRQSLANSLNIPAVKALYINGIDKSLEVAHNLGDKSYCANGEGAGLSMAIGGGCSVRPVEHANAYATIARGGNYKDLAYYLEVKNSAGDVIESWKDSEGTRAVDPQVAYMIADILADAGARQMVFGASAWTPGFYSNYVKYGSKTGTTENGHGRAKDSWSLSISPVLATAIWSGNHDGAPLASDSHTVPWKVNAAYQDAVHEQVYLADGRWNPGDWISQPDGITRATVNGKNDLVPSWFNHSAAATKTETMVFDSVSKKKATDCTPDGARVEVSVSKMIDPMTNTETTIAEGYDTEHDDDVHSCSDAKPNAHIDSIKEITNAGTGSGDKNHKSYEIKASASKGKFDLESCSLTVDGVEKSTSCSASVVVSDYTSVSFTARDTGGYVTVDSRSK